MKNIFMLLSIALLVTMPILASDLKERRIRDANGNWITSTSIEIGEYDSKWPKLEMELYLGKTTTNDSVEYWIEIESEAKLNNNPDKSTLNLESITINGITIESNQSNTTITSSMKRSELKEIVRIQITQEEMQAILASSNWSATLESQQYGTLNMWMENPRKLNNARYLI